MTLTLCLNTLLNSVHKTDNKTQLVDFNLISFDLYNRQFFNLMHSTDEYGSSFLSQVPPFLDANSSIFTLGGISILVFLIYCTVFFLTQRRSMNYASKLLEIFLDIPRITTEMLKDNARSFDAYCKVSSSAVFSGSPEVRGDGPGLRGWLRR